MKSLYAAASAVALVAFAAPAFAQSAPVDLGVYGNLGYSYVDADAAHFNVIDGRLGVRTHKYLGAEAELGFGLGSEDVGAASVKLKDSYAGYVVGFLPVAPNADLFARVGYGHSSLKASAGGASATDGENSVNYGAGGQYFVTAHDGVRAEYTRYDFNHNGGAANVWSVAYVRKF